MFPHKQQAGVRPAICAISDLVVRVAARAPLFQQAGGHLALTPDPAERLTIKSNSRALSFYV